jgi:hypothetical protein
MSRVKHEEMVPLADMVWASFKRDQAEIEAENHTFTAEYLDDFKVATDKVRDLEQSDSMLVEQKAVSGQLYLAADGMTKDLKLFQIVLKKSGLNTKVVSVLLKNIKKRNMEGALVNIKSIGQIVDANLALFTSKGMKASFPNYLADKFIVLTDLSNKQTQIMKDRKTLTEGNEGSYAALNVFIKDVCGIGKTIYIGMAKGDEYNVTKMVKKLHSSGGINPTPPPTPNA